MKKKHVKINGIYLAKVSNRKVKIKILSVTPLGGWHAVNLTTNREIYIKTAGRLTEIPYESS